MAKCVNCGTNLNAFNETFPLWDGTHDRFCSRCKNKYEKVLKIVPFNISEYDSGTDYILKNHDKLRGYEFSESGIKYIGDFLNSAYQKNVEFEEKKRQNLAEKNAKAEMQRIEIEKQLRLQEKRKEIAAILPQLREEFLSTTGINFEGYKIKKYIGIRSGEIVLGTGFFSEASALVSDFFGDSNVVMSNKITRAKDAAISELIDNCIFSGANAVLGVDIDFSMMANNMIVACANGTAVIIEKM